MLGLDVADIVVISLYFSVMLYIGYRASKRVKNQEDFFLGGRRFGKVLQIFSSFGQGTSAHNAVGTTTTTYRDGASGIWSALMMLWATPVYWLVSPWYRRMRLLTLGDYFEERYGSKKMAAFYSIVASIFMTALIALGMRSMSSAVAAISLKDNKDLTPQEMVVYEKAVYLEALQEKEKQGSLSYQERTILEKLQLQKPVKEFSYINEFLLIWIMVFIVFIYAISGGLEAAVYTDMVQGIFIILLSLILIPFGLAKINDVYGGEGIMNAASTMHRELPSHFFDVFGSAASLDFTWYYIAALSLMATINVAVQANQLTASGSAKDEFTARVGVTIGYFMKRFCTVLWGLTGLISVCLYASTIKNPDYVWGHASRDLLGGLNLGLVGLMISCLLAALMSTADTLMITASSVLTHNLYMPLKSGKEERHYVKAGRIFGGCVLIGAALLATWFDTILEMLKFVWEFNVVLAAAFWCGVKWRRATPQGAWASMGVAAALFVVLPILVPTIFSSFRSSENLLKQTEPPPVTMIYQASPKDVKNRTKEIETWRSEVGKDKPQKIEVGDPLERTIQPPKKSIFWSKGIREIDGVKKGEGLLYIDMVALDKIVDLGSNPRAVNETIRISIRIVLPFIVMVLVSMLTRKQTDEQLNKFFMKMRTPVLIDREKDSSEVALSLSDPERYRESLLFPNSGFEFFKWTKQDAIGFGLSVATVFAIVGGLYLILNLGA